MSSLRSLFSSRMRPDRIIQSSKQTSRWLHRKPSLHTSNRISTLPLKRSPFQILQSRSANVRSFASKAGPQQLDPTPHLGSPAAQSLSQRLKALSKEYGWTALAVYLALSALDFPFCYLAVQLLGPERVGKAEHAVVDWIRGVVNGVAPDLMQSQEVVDANRKSAALESKGGKATIGTQLVLAYAVHKSLIFFRVPLTAAVLPKVVKTLRSYGWKVGRTKPKVTAAAAVKSN